MYLKKAQDAESKDLYLKAAADFTEALRLKPGELNYLESRGDTYYKLRLVDPARYAPLTVADYTEILKSKPNDGTVHRRRAEAYGDMGQTAKAIADYTRAIGIDPRDRLAYFRRGVLKANHELPGAKEDLEAALRIDPSDAIARRWLDWVNSRAVAAAPKPKPKATPSPSAVAAKPRPTPSSVAAAPAVSKPSTSAAAPASSGNPWDAPVAEAKRLIAAGQPDRAIVYTQAEIAKVPADTNPLVNLFNTRHRSLLKEQAARAQLAKRDYAASIDTMTNALTELLDAVNKDLSSFVPQTASIPDRDTILNLYEMRIPTAMDLFEMGKRGISMYDGATLTEDQTMRRLLIGFLKVGSGEVVAGLHQTVAKGHIANAEDCRGVFVKGCGPGSVKDKTMTEANLALGKINKAIEIAPALKELFATRARIHRFMGNAAAAAADEAKAAQK